LHRLKEIAVDENLVVGFVTWRCCEGVDLWRSQQGSSQANAWWSRI